MFFRKSGGSVYKIVYLQPISRFIYHRSDKNKKELFLKRQFLFIYNNSPNQFTTYLRQF